MDIPLPFKQLRKQQLQTWINHNTDFECGSLETVSEDASFRQYYRFSYRDQSIIAVDAPPESENASQFIAVAKAYQAKGVKVPEIYAYDLEHGFYIQQDFGDRMFGNFLTAGSCEQLYSKALANIPLIQNCLSTEKAPLPVFDGPFIDRELNIFTEWLLEKYLQ